MASDQGVDLSVNGWNAAWVDQQYERWQEDPNSVGPEWRTFFQGFELGSQLADADGQSSARPTMAPVPQAAVARTAHTAQGRVDSLVYHYRDIGHRHADLDPLGTERPLPEYLTLGSFGLSEQDLGETFDPGHLPLDGEAPLREIIALLEDTYCRHIGVEYMHIQDRARRRWLQQQMEPVRNRPEFSRGEKLRILRELIEADGFENFLQTRYRGKKRFGLDGGRRTESRSTRSPWPTAAG